MSILQDVVVISLDVHIWSGRKKLRPEDLTTTGTLPPEKLVSLGSKKIFDPQALKPFGEIKREAESVCLSKGVRFLKGFAIPKSDIKTVVEQLNALQAKFDMRRDSFLATYDAEKERWKLQYPGYERLIETELLPKAVAAAKLSFDYQPFCVNSVEDDLAQLITQGGANLALGLAGQLFIEVANQAGDFVKRSLHGRTEVTQKFLRPIRAIRSKLAGLAFLDGSVTPVVDEIDKALAQMPDIGKIAGIHLQALRGICALLADPARMREHGQRIIAGETSSMDLPPTDESASWNEAPDETAADTTEHRPAIAPAPMVSPAATEPPRSIFL